MKFIITTTGVSCFSKDYRKELIKQHKELQHYDLTTVKTSDGIDVPLIDISSLEDLHQLSAKLHVAIIFDSARNFLIEDKLKNSSYPILEIYSGWKE